MRWKLLIIVSLVATIVGAGGTLGIAIWLMGWTGRRGTPDLYVLLTLLIPAASIAVAALFVYRHTARWRKTQALSTALLSIVLTLTALIAASAWLSSNPDPAPPAPPPRNTA